jgi:hypothetical protein
MSNTQQPAASFGGSDKQVRMPSSRHSWRRLHASTWGVAGAIVAILALIVVPGSPDNHGVFVSGPLFYEHGWPFVFLDRYFPSPPGRASPGDPLMKFLKNWRDEKGLRWATSGSEFWLWSENGFLHDGPAWLDATRWPIRGEALVSLAGLMLDLAVAFAISAGIASAYEWWARRHWQYSLRCSFAVCLLIAIGLVWWRLSINKCERESRAIATLRNKGLDVSWCCGGPVWLVKLVGPNHLRPFHRVVSISRHIQEDAAGMAGQEANVSSVVDSDMSSLHEWSHLQQLFLGHTRITDAGLKNVEGLNNLEVLDLEGTLVTDAGLGHLHDLRTLRFLVLDSTRVTDAGLPHLKRLPHLHDLSLNNTQISDGAMPSLKALPELNDLSLDRTNVTDSGLQHLKAFPCIKTIRLNGTRVTDDGLRNLEGVPQLEKLELSHTKVTEMGVARLRQALPKCTIRWKDEL